MGMGAFTRLSLRRKWRRRWAFFASDAELVAQERSSLMCSPRKLVLLTRSTAAPSMVSGGCSVWLFLKSTTISFVLLIFSRRLLSLHHVVKRLTSFL